MDLGLEGRHALITGSSAGIGYAIARGLAAEDAKVTITGRTQASVDAALARLRKDLPKAAADGVAADCASAAGAQAVFARVADVDILVNNLGIYARMPFFEIPDAEWLRYFEVNVLSGVRFARQYARAMAQRAGGRDLGGPSHQCGHRGVGHGTARFRHPVGCLRTFPGVPGDLPRGPRTSQVT